MRDQATLDSLLWVPFSYFDRARAQSLKARLTFRKKAFKNKGPDTVIENFVMDEGQRLVGVPVVYGLHLFKQLTGCRTVEETRKRMVREILCDGFSISTPTCPDPFHPLAPKGQDQFFNDTLRAAQTELATLVEAPTGAGKTPTALYVFSKLGKSGLVVVPNTTLLEHWVKEAKKFLGFTDDQIGRLGGGHDRWEGCPLVIAVINTVAQKEFPLRFYRQNFGFICWDEAHRLGAATFSKTIQMFNARHRLALTATPERKDGCHILFHDYFGAPSVFAPSDAIPCDVRVVDIPTHMPNWRYVGRARLITQLTTNRFRNENILEVVKALYRRGRCVLVLSDRVSHCQRLMDMASRGKDAIPLEEMGLCTRSYFEDFENETGKKTFKDAELEKVRDTANVIFSTYGMGKEGMDIPRLDAGVDATPRADGVQALGRIRRPMENKRRPVWFTIRDTTIPVLVGYTRARLNDYRNANASIVES